MKMNVNGVVIEGVQSSSLQSNEGENFMVLWDKDSVPIHITHEIVDYLYAVIHQPPVKKKPVDNNNSPFLEGALN